jgi:DNA-binding MarR family transcriptional regulator
MVQRNEKPSGPNVPEPYLGAWRSFLNAHAVLIEQIEEALSAAELPPLSWYDVLWALYRAPERKLRIGELAGEVVTIGRTGLTRLVDRIEAEGLVRREPVAGDRRGSFAVLTQEGVALLRRMWPVYAAGIERHFSRQLSDAEAKRLGDTLARISAAARADK